MDEILRQMRILFLVLNFNINWRDGRRGGVKVVRRCSKLTASKWIITEFQEIFFLADDQQQRRRDIFGRRLARMIKIHLYNIGRLLLLLLLLVLVHFFFFFYFLSLWILLYNIGLSFIYSGSGWFRAYTEKINREDKVRT